MTLDTQQTLFQAVKEKNTLTIQIPPRLTVLEAESFREFFQETVQRYGSVTRVILDFEQTHVMDSSGLGAFLGNFYYAQSQGIQLISQNIAPEVMMVFSLTGLDEVIPFEAKPSV
jgi:anti-anti-sigma factor